MTRDEAKKAIIQVIADSQGCKSAELVAKLANNCSDALEFEIPALLEELFNEKKIEEMEYILPNIPHRIKSLFFPAGTTFSYASDADAI